MPKILHYIGSFSHLAETFIFDLLKNLESAGDIRQHVVCHHRFNIATRPFVAVDCVPFTRSLWTRIQLRISGRQWTSREMNAIAAILERESPNLIHAHFGINGVRIGALLNQSGSAIPLIVHCHGTDVLSMPYTNCAYRKQLLALVSRPKTRFIANTDFLKQAMLALGIPEHLISVVRYSVNKDLFIHNVLPPKAFTEHPTLPLRLIAIGRMIRWKGHRYLMEGLALFLQKHPGAATLTLIGDGEERIALEKLCRELSLEAVVDFRGAVPHNEVANSLRQHDLLIQPSIVDPQTRQCESFGMTIIEAIASGLPVAVSRSGGMPELIAKETPWSRLFEPASAGAIAKVIENFHTDGSKLSSNQDYANERLEYYCWKNQRTALMEAYEKALDD